MKATSSRVKIICIPKENKKTKQKQKQNEISTFVPVCTLLQ